MNEEAFMRRAIELAAVSLSITGTLPYGAVIVKNDCIIAEGTNRSIVDCDPTSHGEIEAIRNACRDLRTTDLTGCDMYTSCEPCAMCVATMYMAGISKAFYATTIADSKQMFSQLLQRDPKWVRRFDPLDVQVEVAKPIENRSMPAQQLLQAEGREIFDAFVKAQA
ncbi:MAG TPA: nucleoside deaminase [Hyphomicrobiaceae bacterium]|nr:nucleoside deaminase [Hyphomicrobiaceae bacterium]